MKKKDPQISAGLSSNRRSFLKRGVAAAGAATIGTGLLSSPARSFAQENDRSNGKINKGDAAILRFLQALETIEADLWRQYAELGGAGAKTPGTVGNSPIDLSFPTALAPLYIAGLEQLDGDMPQYIDDNTDDELSHESFLRNYLESKGEPVADLSRFFNLSPSQVTGVPNVGRLTNLTQLTVDTSWWTRYRSDSMNPDLGDSFAQAIPTLAVGQHTAIPRTNADLSADPNQPGGVSIHTQAIANTAGFHFAFIEQGGSSLYPQLAQRASNPEVLRVLLSIGPSETSHFQTWHDKAGNAIQLTDTDTGFPGSTGATVTFPNLNDPSHTPAQADELQTNLIMPEPTFFLNKKFGPVSIIRPTETQNAATAALQSLMDDGLFIGHTSKSGKSDGFLELLRQLASEADEARREVE
jgi:hypothetical protein